MYKPVQIKPIRKVRKLVRKSDNKKEKPCTMPKDIDDMIFSDEITIPSER